MIWLSRKFLGLGRHLFAFALIAVIMVTARASLADHYHIPSGSMQPTLDIGDRVFVSKLAYGIRIPFTNVYVSRFGDPMRGDVVILESPEDGETLIKRVVGVPGDTISVDHGQLLINGKRPPVQRTPAGGLAERLDTGPHAVTFEAGFGPDLPPLTLGEDEFLVMGDNRGDSYDGRMFGTVDRGAILGKALAVYYGDGEFTWDAL